MNIAHEILQPNDGHAGIKINETKATKLPEGALFDCYTYDPQGLSKTGNFGRVNEKLKIKNIDINPVFFVKFSPSGQSDP